MHRNNGLAISSSVLSFERFILSSLGFAMCGDKLRMMTILVLNSLTAW